MKVKLKVPKLFKPKRTQLMATAARRPLRIAAATDYENLAEPRINLARALLIVLLLHIVAVAGIVAFNAIKTRPASVAAATAATNPAHQSAQSAANTASPTSPSTSAKYQTTESKSARPTSKASTKDAKLPAESGKTYVVVKGDTPVTIAKKFKISYDDLLALNHIDDPRKLKIGQKLLIPSKPGKGKKTNE
jgi:LysM repeat protein